MHTNSEIQEYLKKIRYLLPIWKKKERNFLSDLSERIQDYSDENPTATIEDIEKHIGSPLEISQQYIFSLNTDELIKRISLRLLLRRIIIVISICLILGLCIFSAFTYKAYRYYKNTVITETETIVERNTN